MDNTKILNLLGLAYRARKVTLGVEFVLKEIIKTENSVVFLASDAGDNIKKKINDKTKQKNFTLISHLTADEISKAIGKENRRLLLVNDKGFCTKFREYLNS